MFRSLIATSALCIVMSILPQTDSKAQIAAPSAEKVAGHYRFESGQILTLDAFDEKLTATSRAQTQSVLTKDANGRFVYPSGSAHITFDLDANGMAKALTYTEAERNYSAKRIDDVALRADSDAWQLKIKSQTPSLGCSAALTRLIDGSRSGAPDYSKLWAAPARAMRSQLPTIQPLFQKLGPTKEVKFLSVDTNGNDIFDVTFENGAVSKWRVLCLNDGHIGGVAFRM
ncbi:MAG TPA: hypothetical protein VK629_02515 [Steroidobacteraceae bacterium]|nr:hypothetical protein [Steroidobacteraceae bacterium]